MFFTLTIGQALSRLAILVIHLVTLLLLVILLVILIVILLVTFLIILLVIFLILLRVTFSLHSCNQASTLEAQVFKIMRTHI